MTSRARKKADQIFVKDGRRAYRRRFSMTEVRIGAVVVLFLVAVLVWVGWRGANPDPSLFMMETDLSQNVGAEVVDRGPLPENIAAEGWAEGTLSSFGYDNLYVKINGREGYYKSFGFQQLYFITLLMNDDAQVAVDIELYDLGEPANAVGAYAGERSPDITPEPTSSGLTHIDRNALYLTHGRYYLRAIGSDESAAVVAQLEFLRERFIAELPSEDLPWGFSIFVNGMGFAAGTVAFNPTNAFSFGFAINVYTAALEGGAELFVTPGGSDADALANQYNEGFMQYGESDGDFVRDRYLGTLASARSAGEWVIGIRSAEDSDAANAALEKLNNVVRDIPLPAEAVENEPAEEGSYESDEY